MEIDKILNVELRDRFREIAAMEPVELDALGLSPRMRDHIIERIVLPDDQTGCWKWSGYHFSRETKPRAGLYSDVTKQPDAVARLLMALLLRVHVKSLVVVCHECGEDKEFSWCTAPHHLVNGTPKRNGARRSLTKVLHGDNNGTRTKPESRPRGRMNPKSRFKGKDDEAVIRAIRATWDALGGGHGLIRKLARAFRKSPSAVKGVISRECYNDIPDNPASALSIEDLDRLVASSGYKRKFQTVWARGDMAPRSIMPEAAKEVFIRLFFSLKKPRDRGRLTRFAHRRFGMVIGSVRAIATKVPPSTRENIRQTATEPNPATEDFWNGAFAQFLPLRSPKGSRDCPE